MRFKTKLNASSTRPYYFLQTEKRMLWEGFVLKASRVNIFVKMIKCSNSPETGYASKHKLNPNGHKFYFRKLH